MVQFLPKLAKFMERSTFSQKIESQLVNMLMDPVFAIREESANALILLSKSIYDRDWLDGLIVSKLEEFAKHKTFMIRIHSVHLMNNMSTHITPQTIKSKFGPIFIGLADDPVPNIRFNVSKSLKLYWKTFSREHQMHLEQQLKKMAESDPDFDAKFFAGKALEELGLGK